MAFSAEEAAEYLEVSVPTLRRYVQSGKLKPSAVIGRSQLFSSNDLRLLKQKLSKE
jgi:excisionase family DNA binding protein